MTARVLQFSGDDLIEYFLDTGTVTTTSLGTVSANLDPTLAYYSYSEDLVYLIGTTGKVYKYNPRTDVISSATDLSAFGSFVTMHDEHIWFADVINLYAISTADFSLVYTFIHASFVGAPISYIMHAASGGRIVTTGPPLDVLDTIYIYTVGGGVPQTIEMPFHYGYDESWGLQRPYIPASDQLFFPAPSDEGTVFGMLADLTNLTVAVISQPVGHYYASVGATYWDKVGNALVSHGDDSTDSFTCIVVVDVATTAIVGDFAKSDEIVGSPGEYGFYTMAQPLGNGTFIGWNGYGHAGVFVEDTPSVEPVLIVPGTDFLFDPTIGYVIVPTAGNFWTKFRLTVEV